jgi:hypothetical protein
MIKQDDAATTISNLSTSSIVRDHSFSGYSIEFNVGSAIMDDESVSSNPIHNQPSQPVDSRQPDEVNISVHSGPSIFNIDDDKEEPSEPWEEIELGKVNLVSVSVLKPTTETVPSNKSLNWRYLSRGSITVIFLLILLCFLLIFRSVRSYRHP